jgi:adenosine deaminase
MTRRADTPDISATPKAELHCHCDGILDPSMLRGFAVQGLDIEPIATALECLPPMPSLERWAAEYQPLAEIFLNPLAERLRLVAIAQRSRWRDQNVQYAELFVSGILGAIADAEPLREWFRALALDLSDPEGIPRVNLVVCLSRTKVARHADRIVDLARAGVIAGVAIAGDELAGSIRHIESHIHKIRAQGVGIEIHVGEVGGPEWIRDALDFGQPHRIGHGVRAFEDPVLVERLAKQRIHLEFCPTSNLQLGVIATLDELPIRQAIAAGIPFSINTDDPGVFHCSMVSELRLVQEAFSLSDADLEQIFQDSLLAAFPRHSAR